MMLVATNGDLTVRELTTFISHVYFKWVSSHNDPKSAEVTNTFLSCQCFDLGNQIHFFKEEFNVAYHE